MEPNGQDDDRTEAWLAARNLAPGGDRDGEAGHIVAIALGKYKVAKNVPKYCANLRKLALGSGGEAAIASATKERAETKNRVLRGSLLDADAVAPARSRSRRARRYGSRICGRMM